MSIASVSVPVPSSGEGAFVNVSTLVGPKTVIFTGLFQGVYELLASHDDSHFVPVLQFDAGGVEGIRQTISGSFRSVRLRVLPGTSPSTSITCEVSAVEGVGQNFFAALASLAAGSSGLTPIVDLAIIFPPTGSEEDTCLICEGGLAGSLVALGSLDGVNFSPLGAFRRDRLPDGAPLATEFSVLGTTDKPRHLRFSIEGTILDTVTVTIGGRVPTSSSAPITAWWPLDQIAYFFLDGDSGDDSHVGYLVAPPGTVFTPAQAAAVAIKTTSRYEQIKPLDGAGHMTVTLLKPRAGGAPYDHIAGDGVGKIDRRRTVHYSLDHARGSDLTNSVTDRKQLGFATADGPYIVQSAVSTPLGLAITCTTPVTTACFDLPKFRARLVGAGGSTRSPVRWGDTTTPPLTNPSVVTLWPGYPGVAVNPGDVLHLELPAAKVIFFEAPDYEANAGDLQPLLAAGLVTHTGSQYGSAFSTEGYAARYAGVRDLGGINLSGSFTARATYYDETNAARNAGVGVVAEGGLYCSQNGVDVVDVAQSTVLPTTLLSSHKISLLQTTLQAAIIQDGSAGVEITQCDYGLVTAQNTGPLVLSACRKVVASGWGNGIVLDPPTTSTTPGTAGPTYTLSDLAVLFPPNPATPQVFLRAGRYAVTFDMRSGSPVAVGSGAQVFYDAAMTVQTLVDWVSLGTTGFEVEGGQRVACLRDGLGYEGDLLPCPRGAVMRLVDAPVGGTYFPAGLVVAAAGPISPDRFQPALAGTTTSIIGVTLTSTVQGDVGYPDGWAVVGGGPATCLQLEGGVTPAPGAPLYLSGSSAGRATDVAPAVVVPVATSLPIGPAGTGGVVAAAWSSSSASGSGSPTAGWDLSLVRFVFLDGDNGDDSNVGYIDAPLGTVFTPAQAAAVAIKTTSKLDTLRPLLGCGRRMQVLAKPRAGLAPYDYSTPGDAAGRDDRSLLSGYGMMHFRGSDLTNSQSDRYQLGMVSDLPGTNPDGSYNILNVTFTSEGMQVQVDANIPLAPTLTKYRLRILHGATTLYGPVRWSSITDNLADKVVAWFVPGPVSPGDKIWFERPGTVLTSFTEGTNYAKLPTSAAPMTTALAGVELSGAALAGAPDGSADTSFCCCVSDSLTATSPEAGISADSVYEGAAGIPLFSGYGLICSTIGMLCRSFVFKYSGQITPLAPGSLCGVSAQKIEYNNSQAASVQFLNGSSNLTFNQCNYGQVMFSNRGHAVVTWARGVTAWSPNLQVCPEGNPSSSWTSEPIASIAGAYNLRIVAEGTEPASPGITLSGGCYLVNLNFRDDSGTNTLSPGNGILLQADESASQTVLITYASLKTTGFEIEGGQKVVCRFTGQGYGGDVLPCPRGSIMRMVDGVVGTTYLVGLVVTSPAATPDRFDIALSDSLDHMRVVGATLTNVVQGDAGTPGGYAVVGADSYLVLQQEAGSPNPISGDALYLSSTSGGTVTNVAPASPSLLLARALPTGPNASTAGTLVPSMWEPELGSSVADWPLTVVRHFVVDDVNGDDNNIGYVDAPLAATSIDPTGKAVKTIARYLSIIPCNGNGRKAVTHFANNNQTAGSTYAETLDYTGFGGYSYFLKRAWTAWLNLALYPCWSTTDRNVAGAKIALPGPNPDGSWTVNTINTTKALVLTVLAGGAALANDAATLYRVRFSGNVTPAMTNQQIGIYKSYVDTLELLMNPGGWVPQIPAAGDTFWIETAGVAINKFVEADGAMEENAAIGFSITGSTSTSFTLGAVTHQPIYVFCHQSSGSSSSCVSLRSRSGVNAAFYGSVGAPDGASALAVYGPTRFTSPTSFIYANQIEWDVNIGSVRSPGSEVNHGNFTVIATYVLAGGGVFLGGLNVVPGGCLLGTNRIGETDMRLMRVVRVMEIYPGVSGSFMSSLKIAGVWFDDAILKLGDAQFSAIGVNLRVSDVIGGPTVNAWSGSTGLKTGFYCRNTAQWNIILGGDYASNMPAITGVNGDILLSGDGWTKILSYADLAKGDVTDHAGNKWSSGNYLVSAGAPRAGTKLTNADDTIVPGTDKASLYELPFGILTANHQVTVQVTSMLAGQAVCIRIRDMSAYTYAIINGGPGAGTLFTKPASPGAVIDVWVMFDGTNMVLDRTVYKDA